MSMSSFEFLVHRINMTRRGCVPSGRVPVHRHRYEPIRVYESMRAGFDITKIVQMRIQILHALAHSWDLDPATLMRGIIFHHIL